ncbi:MAG TPA: response regulator transcription factor [Verrucomicrobiae bacterium]|nr:response regulator transcription factor [Verrucomicrobiae bacterium]
MAKEIIVIIEDEKNIVELLQYNLEKEGYRVFSALRGEEGLDLARKHLPSVLILDLMLPGMDGLEICKTLRQNPETSRIPILMLTARGEEVDKVLGLELGADDYVTKPFSPRELVARIKAVLRRSQPAPDTALLRCGPLELNAETHQVTLKGKILDLTSKEFHLLKALMAAQGRVLSRAYLLEHVWEFDRGANIETRTVDMHVGQLRKKLKSEALKIVTVKNAGYRFEREA